MIKFKKENQNAGCPEAYGKEAHRHH